MGVSNINTGHINFGTSSMYTGRPVLILDAQYTYWMLCMITQNTSIDIGRPVYILDAQYTYWAFAYKLCQIPVSIMDAQYTYWPLLCQVHYQNWASIIDTVCNDMKSSIDTGRPI